MIRAALFVGLALGSISCSGDDAPAAASPAPAATAPHAAHAQSEPTTPDGVTASRAAARPRNRQARPIDIALKSTPPGAIAAVDGQPLGATPTFWAGESDGLPHEFTFTRAGYASARYRFVPVASGVVHATLEAVTEPLPASTVPPVLAPPPEPPVPPAKPSGSPVGPQP